MVSRGRKEEEQEEGQEMEVADEGEKRNLGEQKEEVDVTGGIGEEGEEVGGEEGDEVGVHGEDHEEDEGAEKVTPMGAGYGKEAEAGWKGEFAPRKFVTRFMQEGGTL